MSEHKDIIRAALNNNYTKFKEGITSELQSRVGAALERKRVEVANSYLNQNNQGGTGNEDVS